MKKLTYSWVEDTLMLQNQFQTIYLNLLGPVLVLVLILASSVKEIGFIIDLEE